MPVVLMFAESLRRHIGLIIVAIFTLGIAMLVSDETKNSLDMDGVRIFAGYLGIAIWCLASLYAAHRLVWLALVARDPSPLRTFLKPCKSFLLDGPRMANFVVGMAAITAFVAGFGVLKGAIALLNPFKWDVAFSDIDRGLHFGRLPHEYFWWLIEWPVGICIVNLFYNLWFFIMIGTILITVAAREDAPLRQQYLMTFMAIWLVAGFFIATVFSSAGPCFFEDLGLGDRYKPLMDALARSSKTWPIWALSTQDMLWEGYTGERPGALGISAFPSIHVATSVLFALYYSERRKLVGVFMWIFAVIIMIGSVVLGWHYAVDGYTGAILAWIIWRVVGVYTQRKAGVVEASVQPA
ncbi:phosphatase PAP2 family protein [Bosea sp. NBC_00550]|uniref:phosphatase PAP2 family protein n=1 Tax=Bosea sp. NBC_00550 TaxID=2969621 RepID=UPI002231CE80|nr:phosphatase PAP2 family protein [Bosea sp. NBC_00550]UZF90382.1 phosphatase PAP2 family protein [Bosea sp. NBC_00550]